MKGDLAPIVRYVNEHSRTSEAVPNMVGPLVSALYHGSCGEVREVMDCLVELIDGAQVGVPRDLLEGLVKLMFNDLDGLDPIAEVLGLEDGTIPKILVCLARNDTAKFRTLIDDIAITLAKMLKLPPENVKGEHLGALFALIQGTDVDLQEIAMAAKCNLDLAMAALYLVMGGERAATRGSETFSAMCAITDPPAK